jgi:predicted porin
MNPWPQEPHLKNVRQVPQGNLMKKSLIAFAVLAASGAAFAQSSVQLYGIVDLVVHKDKGNDLALTSGGMSGSRIGFKGTKDVGAGLKANFALEQGFDADTGLDNGVSSFSRQAYVGLAGAFGELKLGKVYTAYDDVAGATNPVFDSVFSPTGLFASGGYAANPSNGLYYTTPAFGGVSGAVSTNLEANNTAAKTTALHVKYEDGPLFVAAAYQQDGDVAKTHYTRLNASYDFGPAKLLAGVAKVGGAGDATEVTLGADIPLSSGLVASAGLATTDNGGTRTTGVGVGVAYSLSKEVTAYGGLRKDNNGGLSRVGAGLKVVF